MKMKEESEKVGFLKYIYKFLTSTDKGHGYRDLPGKLTE